MSGHSKWATTKHKKAVVDARRGKLFARLVKNIEVAARQGGGDPDGNPTLYDAIQKARKSSVPLDNIERAVKRGSGVEAGGADWQTIMYEGYGPNGVAVLIECLSDNRNRAAGEVRVAMTRNGGSMADPGSVSYLFSRKGVVLVPKATGLDEDAILLAVLEAGAEEERAKGRAHVRERESAAKGRVDARGYVREEGRVRRRAMLKELHRGRCIEARAHTPSRSASQCSLMAPSLSFLLVPRPCPLSPSSSPMSSPSSSSSSSSFSFRVVSSTSLGRSVSCIG